MNIKRHDHDIERAISFLVSAIQMHGHNPKPVILHSIRVGLRLYERSYPKDVVIAALLHDVLEDTDIKRSAITRQFGPKVAKLVEANSFDTRINDWVLRYQENFKRCRRAGKTAMIVKATDILDNSDFCCFDHSGRANRRWIEKMKHFIDLSNDALCGEVMFQELVEKYRTVLKRMNTKR